MNERYYDAKTNGVNWKEARRTYKDRVEAVATDAEFYHVLQQMVGELHDAHTRVRDPYKRYLFDRLEVVSPGVTLGEVLAEEVPAFDNLLTNKYDLRILGRLAKLFRRRRIDAVVTVGAGDKMFWGRLAAWRAGVPVVLSALPKPRSTQPWQTC